MSSVFSLDDAGRKAYEAEAARNPIEEAGDDAIAKWGDITEAPRGVWRSIAKLSAYAADVATPALTPIAKSVDGLFGTNAEGFLKSEQAKIHAAVDEFAPDPETTGIAGRVLNSAADVIFTAIIGKKVSGAISGAAALVGVTAQHTSDVEARKKGIDPKTAAGMSVVEGAAIAGSVLLPMSIGGSVLKNTLLFGPGINVAVGGTQRGITSEWLRSRGYPAIADQYRIFDGTQIATEFVLGAVFGGAGAKFHAQIKPSHVDAALTLNNAKHVADSAPGIPTTLEAQAAHMDSFETAFRQLAKGEPVAVRREVADAEFVRETRAPVDVAAQIRTDATPAERSQIDEIERLAKETAAEPSAIGRAVGPQTPESTPQPVAETAPRVVEPWQMSRAEWDTERAAIRPEVRQQKLTKAAKSQEVERSKKLQRLLYGVPDEAAAQLNAAAKGKATLTPAQVEQLQQRVDTPVQHVDVVRKALSEGKTVPESAVADYPELRAQFSKQIAPTSAPVDTQAKAPDHPPEAGKMVETEPGDSPAISQEITDAQAIVDASGDMLIPTGEIDADGNPVTLSAKELLARADAEIKQAQQDGHGFMAAVTCFLQRGAA